MPKDRTISNLPREMILSCPERFVVKRRAKVFNILYYHVKPQRINARCINMCNKATRLFPIPDTVHNIDLKFDFLKGIQFISRTINYVIIQLYVNENCLLMDISLIIKQIVK